MLSNKHKKKEAENNIDIPSLSTKATETDINVDQGFPALGHGGSDQGDRKIMCIM